MKKIICLVISLFMILGLTACGTAENSIPNDDLQKEVISQEVKIENKTDKIKKKIFSATDIEVFKELSSDVCELNEDEKNLVAQKGAVYLCNLAFSGQASNYTNTEDLLKLYDDLAYVLKTFEVLGLNHGEYEEHYNFIVHQRERALTLSQYDEFLVLGTYMSNVIKLLNDITNAIKEDDSYSALEASDKLKKYSYEIKYDGNCINSICFRDAILDTCESACDMAKYYDVLQSTRDTTYFRRALNENTLAVETMGKYFSSYNNAYANSIMSIPMLSYNWETIWLE